MTILYQITIFPIVTLIEFVYRAIESFLRNTGVSIVGVSLVVNILCLPLYAVAERLQNEERAVQRRMKHGVDNIKAVFKGDERYMMLSTLYRQHHYHPAFALRSTFGLLIQIPFFIAAYKVITALPDLLGRGFLFIPDLGSPDAMLTIAGLSINVLPLIMTAINVAASAVYTKGFSFKEKAQLYIVAAIFCVLLYNSPAGLVFYWTLNNLFSLFKNILFKSKRAGVLAYGIMTALVGAAAVGVFLRDTSSRQRLYIVILFALVALAPIIKRALSSSVDIIGKRLSASMPSTIGVFVTAMAACAILVGLVIPASLIASSVSEFSFTSQFANPLSLLFGVFTCAIGCFLFWPISIFLLFGKKIRVALALLSVALFAFIAVNAFVFQGNYGTLSPALLFDDPGVLKDPIAPFHLDLVIAVIAAAIALFATYRTGKKIILPALALTVASFLAFSSIHMLTIAREFAAIKNAKQTESPATAKPSSCYTFSRNGKNVLFIMLDRGIGPFVADIFKEDPSLNERLSGFTWYSNTFSFGGHTIMGGPPLFGGYEYTPERINARDKEPLTKKIDESCEVIPRLFSEHGWSVAVSDMPYGDYASFPGVRSYKLNGKFQDDWLTENGMSDFLASAKNSSSMTRKMLVFGIFKTSPAFLRWTIYDMGGYWQMASDVQTRYDYLCSFAALERIGRLSSFVDDGNNLTVIENDITHNQTFLQYPDYSFKNEITDIGKNAFEGTVAFQLYHVNNAAFHSLARLMDTLKKEGVYDNTRIIIASDHGFKNLAYKDTTRYPSYFKDESLKPSYFSPILMVKDFKSVGPLKEDRTFMSNADVPEILSSGVIENAANPFSGVPFEKSADKRLVRLSGQHAGRLVDHDTNTFRIAADQWITLHDSIFDESNWKWEQQR